ncbi:5-oxoprolinase subunit C family protein [Paenibacillus roseipurpureus]|uniref:Biotin-dependent carboxyltransferase family protein n=1 Tax=Paenibacillus roseopurpureus TaxID=2918901 RepID=A0AA96LMA8_9BACL|nr:biotin-dependent carboxyltransferase family protein [Paenibacillus sp. MBLB1832]WNR43628.1 biotin-dependent carboxyltransferase family protein [Paenibacillus sp. MBLB1832]
MSFEVIKPGILSTLQDRGRYGHRKHGVIVSGPVDSWAHRAANVLVGNGRDAATLEMTLQGPHLVAQRDMQIAICGADMDVQMDGTPVPLWRPVFIPCGSQLRFHYAREGCRAYLAVRGGFQGEAVLGSQSTYLRAGIGGLAGRALRAGDWLGVKEGYAPFPPANFPLTRREERFLYGRVLPPLVSTIIRPGYRANPVIRMIRGREASLFSTKSWSHVLSQPYHVSTQSDRMGYRLLGEQPLELGDGASYEMISEAVTAGTLQVPSSGQPILLLADCQTTGGYPRIGHVIATDLPLVAQVKPGGTLYFQEVTHKEAQEQLLLQEMDLAVLEAGLRCWMRG